MNCKVRCFVRVCVAVAVFVSATAVRADCGSVPFAAPMLVDMQMKGRSDGGAELSFDPLQVSVFEPKQRAIILWDGQEEILLLSTDQRATRASAVLEVIPLPSRPTVRLGSFQTFENAQALMIEKRMWLCAHGGARVSIQMPDAGKITFHEKMGAHEVAVAQVVDAKRFVAFVQDFLKKTYQTRDAPIRPEFVKIIESYLDAGFEWFAFDVIVLGDSNKSRQPIEYRFQSDEVFYPMRISSLEQGKTEVELLVFSKKGASEFVGLSRERMEVLPQLRVERSRMGGLATDWGQFFGEGDPLVMDQWKIGGELKTFQADVRVR